MNATILTIVLGGIITSYAALGTIGKEITISANHEKFAAPVFGFLTGIVGGMTGSPAYPGIFFLNGLGFKRNQLVQALGIAFCVVTLTIALSLKTNNILSLQQFTLSMLAVLPAMIGMSAGARLRHKMSEKLFKKYFYFSMLALGIYLISRSLLRLA